VIDMQGARAVGAGEGETVWFLQNRMTVKATAELTGGAYGLVESWIAPGASPPLHIHRLEDEAFWVLEGTVRFHVGDEEVTAGPGSYVFAPRDIPHSFIVEGDSAAHMLTLLSPGGGEQFFVDGGVEAAGPGLPAEPVIDIPKLQSLGPRYGNEIIGPPLTPR
jgi:quercetin dioxygenase-like cupin family protein